MSDPIDVWCTTCHRLERWQGAVREVVSPGGARVPSGSPVQAAWEALESSVAAGGPLVVARCGACGQPMFAEADSGLSRMAWALPLPSGELEVGADAVIRAPEGSISASEARRRVMAAVALPPWYRRLRPAHSLFQAAVLSSVLGPLSAFAIAVMVLGIFMHPAVGEWMKLLGLTP